MPEGFLAFRLTRRWRLPMRSRHSPSGASGLTQAALAERIGVAQNNLSDVESSKRTGRIGLWLKLSAALGVPVEVLVDEG